MALFSVSGSGDWGVSDVGEILCQNFKQDNSSRKKKQKNKHKVKKRSKEIQGKIKKNLEKFNSVVSDKSTQLVNKNKRLIKKAKRKLNQKLTKNPSEDKIPLNSSFFNDTQQNKRKGLKRKHSSTSEETDKPKTKKAKKEINNGSSKVTKLVKNIESQIKKVVEMVKGNDETKRANKRKKKKLKTAHINGENHNDKQVLTTRQKPNNAFNQLPNKINPVNLNKRKQQLQKLKKLLSEKDKQQPNKLSTKERSALPLRERMMEKLKAARFRFLNEQIYNTTGQQTEKAFRQDPEAFKAYHEGYKLQVKRWPMNPVDKIIKTINKMNKNVVIADFGCGEAKLAQSVEQEVHSFDLVAANDYVTPCDMAHVPLEDSSVDVAVFCLSLMGTNLKDFILEANRVLKVGGILKIAEVQSRFEEVNIFITDCKRFGFKKTWMDSSHNLFYFIDFKKEGAANDKKKLPAITLQPCVYKKR